MASIVMLHVMIRIDALIAAVVSNIGLPILELRFNFGLTYDLCVVIVSNLCFISHLFSHVGLFSQAIHFVINFALTYMPT